MENIRVIVCYDNEDEFDNFLLMSNEDALKHGEKTGNIYSLQGFQDAANSDGYINTASYFRFIQD